MLSPWPTGPKKKRTLTTLYMQIPLTQNGYHPSWSRIHHFRLAHSWNDRRPLTYWINSSRLMFLFIKLDVSGWVKRRNCEGPIWIVPANFEGDLCTSCGRRWLLAPCEFRPCVGKLQSRSRWRLMRTSSRFELTTRLKNKIFN